MICLCRSLLQQIRLVDYTIPVVLSGRRYLISSVVGILIRTFKTIAKNIRWRLLIRGCQMRQGRPSLTSTSMSFWSTGYSYFMQQQRMNTIEFGIQYRFHLGTYNQYFSAIFIGFGCPTKRHLFTGCLRAPYSTAIFSDRHIRVIFGLGTWQEFHVTAP